MSPSVPTTIDEPSGAVADASALEAYDRKLEADFLAAKQLAEDAALVYVQPAEIERLPEEAERVPVWMIDPDPETRILPPLVGERSDALFGASPDGTILRNPAARAEGHDFPRVAKITTPLNRRVRRTQAKFWRSADGRAAQRALKRALRKEVDTDA